MNIDCASKISSNLSGRKSASFSGSPSVGFIVSAFDSGGSKSRLRRSDGAGGIAT